MKLTVTNFRGIKNAIIELSRITLITGANYQGKSSIIQALQAALCTVLPFDGLKKNQAKLIVNGNQKDSTVLFESPSGEQTIKYPTCESQSSGVPVNISEYASGLKSFALIPVKDRAKELQVILKSDPDKTNFDAAMAPILPIASSDKLWETIDKLGWDAAHEQVKTKCTQLKGEWCGITGERAYGSDKAGNWYPAEWEQDLTRKTIAELKSELVEAEKWYEIAVSNQAVSQSEIDGLKKQCADIAAYRKTVTDLETVIADKRKRKTNIEKSISEMQKPDPDTCECPNCKTKLQYQNGTLILAEVLTEKQIADRKKAMEAAQLSIFDLKTEIERHEADLSKARTTFTIAEQAEQKLKKLSARKTGEENPQAIEKTKSDLERARNRLSVREKYDAAHSKHKAIIQNVAIIDVLSPNGLRKTSVANAMDKLHSEIQKYSDLAKWADVLIDDEMSVYMHGVPYSLLSKSEKFRCRTLLQIVFSKIIGDTLVIIDDIDELDADSRPGFLKLCLGTGLNFVLGMAESKTDRVPKNNDWLTVYRVCNGEVVE